MIVYEVNLTVRQEIEAEFLAWLEPHIDEMLGFDGFQRAQVFNIVEPADQTGWRQLSVHYWISSQQQLEDYLKTHAPRMREDGLQRFADQFSAQRRILSAH